MRWNAAKAGDKRWRRIFLFTPRKIGRTKVWLEWIWAKEVYREFTFMADSWVEIDWRLDHPESPVIDPQDYSESRVF
jgi:hypothetical protein